MFGNSEIELSKENNKKFYYSKLKIKKEKEELEKFLKENPSLKNIDELRIMKSTEALVDPTRKKSFYQIEGFLFRNKEITARFLSFFLSFLEKSRITSDIGVLYNPVFLS